MKDRVVENPNRYLMEPVEGMEGVVDLIPFPGTVLEEGTPLNKATLLSDNTASMLGLESGEPTVDEALAQVPTSHMLHRMIGASSELTVSEVSPGDSIGVSDMDADTGKRVTVHNLAQYVYTKSTGRESTFQKLIMGRLF